MKLLLALALAVLAVSPANGQDFELELTEQALNRLVAQLGDAGSGGVHRSSALASLGYTGCVLVGALDCASSTSAATGQQGAKQPSVALALCQGPDGKGAIVPADDAVGFQWWITEARFTVAAQQLRFTARVRYRVGSQWFSEEKTVPASLSLDVASQRLRMDVSSFKVPIRLTVNGVTETITEVDVSRHASFGIPISAQTFQVTDLEGRPRTLTSRAQSASVAYLPGKIQVRVDAALY
jgi:hypothetical protein